MNRFHRIYNCCVKTKFADVSTLLNQLSSARNSSGVVVNHAYGAAVPVASSHVFFSRALQIAVLGPHLAEGSLPPRPVASLKCSFSVPSAGQVPAESEDQIGDIHFSNVTAHALQSRGPDSTAHVDEHDCCISGQDVRDTNGAAAAFLGRCENLPQFYSSDPQARSCSISGPLSSRYFRVDPAASFSWSSRHPRKDFKGSAMLNSRFSQMQQARGVTSFPAPLLKRIRNYSPYMSFTPADKLVREVVALASYTPISALLSAHSSYLSRKNCHDLMVKLGQMKKWQHARWVFGWMSNNSEIPELSHLTPSQVTCGLVIAIFANAKRAYEAQGVFNYMRSHDMLMTAHHYAPLIRALTASGNFDRAEALLAELDASGHEYGISPLENLMAGYGERGHLDEMLVVLERIKARGLELRPTTYRLLIERFAAAGRLEEMEATFEEAVKGNTPPPYGAYLAMASAYGEAGRLRDFEGIFRRLQEAGFKDVAQRGYVVQMQVYGKLGVFTGVTTVVEEMLKNQTQISPLCLQVAIEQYLRAGDYSTCAALVRRLLNFGSIDEGRCTQILLAHLCEDSGGDWRENVPGVLSVLHVVNQRTERLLVDFLNRSAEGTSLNSTTETENRGSNEASSGNSSSEVGIDSNSTDDVLNRDIKVTSQTLGPNSTSQEVDSNSKANTENSNSNRSSSNSNVHWGSVDSSRSSRSSSSSNSNSNSTCSDSITSRSIRNDSQDSDQLPTHSSDTSSSGDKSSTESWRRSNNQSREDPRFPDVSNWYRGLKAVTPLHHQTGVRTTVMYLLNILTNAGQQRAAMRAYRLAVMAGMRPPASHFGVLDLRRLAPAVGVVVLLDWLAFRIQEAHMTNGFGQLVSIIVGKQDEGLSAAVRTVLETLDAPFTCTSLNSGSWHAERAAFQTWAQSAATAPHPMFAESGVTFSSGSVTGRGEGRDGECS
eukprot:TRINITY_DN1483_c0_g1_i1.p1 TRINITY_DN1483_c0_g1~~TRINITY_DN1483_c0_g1_i1.p1  ORF type:complete len:1000 (-),score=99.64 TRINITY_DN1483_c0_g1_i1:171-2996(-)